MKYETEEAMHAASHAFHEELSALTLKHGVFRCVCITSIEGPEGEATGMCDMGIPECISEEMLRAYDAVIRKMLQIKAEHVVDREKLS